MIVQVRRAGLRLIRQHDHALMAGQLAHAWRPEGDPLPFRLSLAVGLHDLAWRDLDREVRYDPATGRPHDFASYPLEPKLRAYSAGLDEMESLDPWVGLLGSLHYASFLDDERAPDFLAAERERQSRLRARLRGRYGPGTPNEGRRPARGHGRAGRDERGHRGDQAVEPDPGGLGDRVERHVEWLKFFDGLSLRLCLSPPGVPDEGLPPWLDRRAPIPSPGGAAIVPCWRSGRRVELKAAPLSGPLRLTVPVRDLPQRSYSGPPALQRAWSEARVRSWRLAVVPGS